MTNRASRSGLFQSEDSLQLTGTLVSGVLSEDALHRVLRRLLRALGAHAVVVCLRPEKSGPSVIKKAVGVSGRLVGIYVEKSSKTRSLASDAVRTGKARVVAGSTLVRYAEGWLFDSGRPGIAAALPLRTRGPALGALLVCRYGEISFTRQEMELMKSVSDQLAMTIENIALVEILHRGKTEWEKTVDALKDLVVILDLKGQIIRVNRAFANAFRRQPQWMIGRNFFSVVYGRRVAPENCPVKKTLATGKRHESELQLGRLQGIYQVSTSALSTPAGEFVGAVALARDMTAWLFLQRQLAQAEKLSAIGEVVAGVSHEINNPLTAILGYAELLLESGLPDAARSDLKKIHFQASRMRRIVQNLLRFAREDKAEMSLININAVLSNSLELKAYELKSANIRVDDCLSPSISLIYGNASQLQQVFLNIINNAQQAMKGQQAPASLVLKTSEEAGCLQVIIGDTGPGIPGDYLARIFDPFFTTKPVGEGTGLGLSLSFGIIKEHGGSIRAESTVGRGTTFIIELPVPKNSLRE
jgi:signal transduction histidine kinase